MTTLAALATVIDPGAVQPPGTEGLVAIMSWVKWVALALAVVGLISGGAMMTIQHRRGEGGELVGRLGGTLSGVVVISAAAALVGFLAT